MVQSSHHQIVPLDATWQEPRKLDGTDKDFCQWNFERPTRVHKFEVEGDTSGQVFSVRVGNEEQIVDDRGIPVEALLLGPIMMPVITPGVTFRIHTKGFTGKIRPIGDQVTETNGSDVKEICQYIDSKLQMAIANASRMADFNDLAVCSEVAGMLIKTGIAIARQYNVDRVLLTNAVMGAIEDRYNKK